MRWLLLSVRPSPARTRLLHHSEPQLCVALAVALVLAEGPIVESVAAVAHGFFGPDVRGGHEPVQGHADIEDHPGHWSLPTSLFVNRVLVRGQRPQATRALTSIKTIGSSGLVPRTSTLVRIAPAIRQRSPRAASPDSRETSTPTAPAISRAPTTYLNHWPMRRWWRTSPPSPHRHPPWRTRPSRT